MTVMMMMLMMSASARGGPAHDGEVDFGGADGDGDHDGDNDRDALAGVGSDDCGVFTVRRPSIDTGCDGITLKNQYNTWRPSLSFGTSYTRQP